MKKGVLLVVFSILGYAETLDYQKIYGGTVYLLDNTLLNGGKYEKESVEIKNYSFNKRYFFKKSSDGRDSGVFLDGSIGYTKYEDSDRDFKDNSIFLRAGGGIRALLNRNLSSDIGVSYTKMFSPKTSKASIYHQFNYDFEGKDNFKPYLNLKSQYSYIDYDKEGVKETKGADVELKLGIKKENMTSLLGAPMDFEGYSQVVLLDKKLAKINDFNALYTVGASFDWKVGALFEGKYTKRLDINFKIQGTKSNEDFKGYKVGAGVKLLSF
jgi:hypothetical protein